MQQKIAELAVRRLDCDRVFSGIRRSDGFGWSGHHDQVLRNHKLGRTCRLAASGPRLATPISIRMSAGVALAYSTKTSRVSGLR